MDTLEQRLLNECRQIASEVLHNNDKPESIDEVWTSEDRQRLAKAYFHEAHWALSHLKDAGYDPELVVRAVSYGDHCNIIPKTSTHEADGPLTAGVNVPRAPA